MYEPMVFSHVAGGMQGLETSHSFTSATKITLRKQTKLLDGGHWNVIQDKRSDLDGKTQFSIFSLHIFQCTIR